MPAGKKDLGLKVKAESNILKFASWYKDAKSYKSKEGRTMTGKYKDFLVDVLEKLADGQSITDAKKDFDEFQESKNKTENDLIFERINKNDPDKIKTYYEFMKQIDKEKKKS